MNISGQVYLDMMNEQVVPEMMERFQYNLFGDELFPDKWWFQDGAGAHRAQIVTRRLHELFGPRFVALHQEVEWPARSPDLTPCDFFLWGYIKDRVFKNPCLNLRVSIINEFENLVNRRDIILRSIRAMQTRAEKCILNNGGHVEGR